VQFVTTGARLVVLLAVAATLAAAGAPSPSASPGYVFRDVAFVTITGHGVVRSLPHGIDCPRTCRALFPRGTHVRFVGVPAAGWQLAGFTSKWCGTGTRKSCGFDLVSPHDCVGGACPLGAFGVRAAFVRKGT
jgi:hypothetical protein